MCAVTGAPGPALLGKASFPFGTPLCGQTSGTPADAAQSKNPAFTHGEKLTYVVSYKAGINTDVAEVTFVTREGWLDGTKVYQIDANGRVYPFFRWFFDLNDSYYSSLDYRTLRPLELRAEIREGKYRTSSKYTYDWDAKQVHTSFRNHKNPTATLKTMPLTEGSFDAYSWQLLETKQRFISDLLSGSLTARSGTDIEDTVLDYAEVKALAVGNPLVKQRVEAANELTRYLTLQRKLVDSRIRMEKELLELPGRLEHQRTLIIHCEEDLSYYQAWKAANPLAADNRLKKEEAEKRKALREDITSAIKSHVLEAREKTLMTYRGFAIVLPANMTPEKPYVWLSRRGKYYVELGDTEIGNLMRIDHALDILDGHLETLKTGLSKLTEKEAELKAELAKEESYSEQIEKYSAEVERLDKKLGVNKK